MSWPKGESALSAVIFPRRSSYFMCSRNSARSFRCDKDADGLCPVSRSRQPEGATSSHFCRLGGRLVQRDEDGAKQGLSGIMNSSTPAAVPPAEHTRQDQCHPMKGFKPEIEKRAPRRSAWQKASTTRNATSNATNTRNNIRKHNPHGTIARLCRPDTLGTINFFGVNEIPASFGVSSGPGRQAPQPCSGKPFRGGHASPVPPFRDRRSSAP